jgi:hypothetical protein
MAELCYNNGRFTKAWFQNLTGIQQCMANLNHLTKSNTKDFSKQTLNELLMSKEPGFDNRKGALNMYCQGTLKLLVPDDAYQDMSKNFLWFLGYISIDVKDRLKSLLYCVAQNFNSHRKIFWITRSAKLTKIYSLIIIRRSKAWTDS